MLRTFANLILAAMLAIPMALAAAAELRIALAADVSSLDPHFLNIAPNINLSSHMFDTLVMSDANGRLVPGLAESWRAIDDTTWQFTLRRGVSFHDGSPLTADDVLFSLDRPAQLTTSPGPFTAYTRQIVAKRAIDDHTIELKTAQPYGPLPLDLSSIFIISKRAAEHARPEDFDSGKALIGTGPFRFAGFVRGDHIDLARNDAWWGGRAPWERVRFRIITAAAPRLAALLAGDVDVMESVPTPDVAHLLRNPKFTVAQRVSWRTIFWTVDQRPRPSPWVSGNDGRALERNPLADVRVRRAISMAIDRKTLVARTMEGLAVPASNIISPGVFGYDDALPVQAYDPQGAKRLLAEAGYPDGFRLTIHGPNNRYVNDERIVQTVAQYLSRIGIKTSVQTLPLSVYFGRARKGEFSVALLGWGSLAGDFALRTLIGTPDPKAGWGTWNWGAYSNGHADAEVRAALGSVDQTQREQHAKAGAALALGEEAVIPLHHQVATWALRKGLFYPGRIDEFTFAHQILPR